MAEGEQYFATLRIPILRGRDFEIADHERKPTPAIVNRTLALQLFGGADPIGAHLIRGREKEEVLEIVGVAADTKTRTLGEAAAPAFYTPDYTGQFLIRVSGDPAQWIEPLRRALAAADPSPALDVRPLRDAVAGALFPMRMAAAFVTSIGGIGLVLALVGIYGSVSYAVSRRTREFGIRAALGATRARILWTALRDGALLLTAGAMVGLLLAISAVRPLVDLLPDGVDPWDPRLFAAAADRPDRVRHPRRRPPRTPRRQGRLRRRAPPGVNGQVNRRPGVIPTTPSDHSQFRLRRIRQHGQQLEQVAIRIPEIQRCSGHPGKHYRFVGRLPVEVERNGVSSAEARGCVEQILKIHSKGDVKVQPLRTRPNFP